MQALSAFGRASTELALRSNGQVSAAALRRLPRLGVSLALAQHVAHCLAVGFAGLFQPGAYCRFVAGCLLLGGR